MKSFRSLMTGCAVASALFAAGIAQARPDDEYRSNVASGDWGSTSSWQIKSGETWVSASDVPASGDTATVRANHVIAVSDYQEITVLTIDASGRLDIDWDGAGPNAELRFVQPGDAAPSLVINQSNGLRLVDGNSTISFAADVAISGTGSMQGLNSGAFFDVAAPAATTVNVTSNVLIHGGMKFKRSGSGTGNFINNQLVSARSGLTIEFVSSPALSSYDDSRVGSCSDFVWSVQDSGSVLLFNLGQTGLSGHFSIGSGATMTVNQNVTTSGKVSNGGTINGSATFTATGGNC